MLHPAPVTSYIMNVTTPKKSTWKLVADGIYRNANQHLYWRPIVNRKRTWRRLTNGNLKFAKEELHELRKRPVDVPDAYTWVGQVIEHYRADGFPDKMKQLPSDIKAAQHEANCKNLVKHWGTIPIAKAGPAECDRYHTWRLKFIKRGCKGNQQVEKELSTLANAFRWAVRCELTPSNPLAERPSYQPPSEIVHCRDKAPTSAEELHAVAAVLFATPQSEVLAFQMLLEAYTGLRTCELLKWAPGQIYGTETTDDKNLYVYRGKKQAANNPYVFIHPGLEALLPVYRKWLAKRYPNATSGFPGHGVPIVGDRSLTHRLRLLFKTGKLPRLLSSHGMRAFFVLIRRSQGIADEQIAFELGHSSNGATIRSTYGGVPQSWRNGGGPHLDWLPTGEPAWAMLDLT